MGFYTEKTEDNGNVIIKMMLSPMVSPHPTVQDLTRGVVAERNKTVGAREGADLFQISHLTISDHPNTTLNIQI